VGLALEVAKASLAGEQGRSRLLVGAEPAPIPVHLALAAREGAVLSLALDVAAALRGGFGFAPVFTAVVPARPGVERTGLVSNTAGSSLTVFDRLARRVTGLVPTGAGPQGLAFDVRVARAYVALSGEDSIDVIDVAAGRSINRIRLAGGDRPRDLALTPDGKLLVVVNPGSRTAAFVDPIASIEVGRVAVGDDPTALVLDRSATRAYVLNRRGNPRNLAAPMAISALSSPGGITVLDLPNRAVAATLTTDPEPVRAAVNRGGTALYVVCAGSQFMSVYSLPDLALVNRIFVGLGTRYVKVDPRTDLIYVGGTVERELHVFDPYSALPVDDFPLPDAVWWAAIDDLENALFALLPERRAVGVVDLTSRKTLSVIEVGSEPYAVVLSGERN
jgi:hypothetical protein